MELNKNLNTSNQHSDFDIKHFQEKFQSILSGYNKTASMSFDYYPSGEFIICNNFFGPDCQSPIQKNQIDSKVLEMKEKTNAIDDALIQLELSNTIPDSVRKIYIKTFLFLRKKFQLRQHSIFFEAEKGGYIIDKAEKLNHLTHVKELLKEIDGLPISETPKEREKVLEYLYTFFSNRKKKLTIEEQNTFKVFLDDMIQEHPFKFQMELPFDTATKKAALDDSSQVKVKTEKFEMEKHQAKKLIQMILDLYGIYYDDPHIKHWTIEETSKTTFSVSHYEKKISMPSGDKKHDVMTLLVKISHELEKHVLVGANTNKFLGQGFFGPDYANIEENLASKIHEGITKGSINHLSDLQEFLTKPSNSFICTFLCENFSLEKATELYSLFLKLGGLKRDEAKNSVIRRKCHIPFDMPGANTNETKYDRGLDELIKQLIDSGNIKNASELYKKRSSFKLGKDDLHLVDELRKEFNVDYPDFFLSLFVTRVLRDKAQKGKGSTKEYEKLLGESYTSMMGLPQLDLNMKKKLVEILQFIKKPGVEDNTSDIDNG